MLSLQDCVDREVEKILDSCTSCGRCAEVCPILPHTAANGTDSKAIVQGVLGLLRGEPGNAAAVAWAEACASSGVCIQACPEPVNPRRMLTLAKNVMNGRAGDGGKFVGHFKSMGETTRVLAGIQADPETMKRLVGRQNVRKERAKVVFWIGCNMPRMSHLVLTLEDVFEVLGIDCEVIGGLNNCCGIIHFWAGDNDTAGKVMLKLKQTVDAFNPETVLTWCPSCKIQYEDHVRFSSKFECSSVEHVSTFLVERLDLLAEKWVKRVDKKVAIHEHKGLEGAAENIRKIVAAIPGISVLEVEQLSQYGSMCSRLNRAPDAKKVVHTKILEGAQAAGVQILITPYHNCQQDLCMEDQNYPFEVRNFITLLGEALGIERYEDKYKKFRLLGDVEKIVEEAAPFIKLNRLNPVAVRRVISKELLRKSE